MKEKLTNEEVIKNTKQKIDKIYEYVEQEIGKNPDQKLGDEIGEMFKSLEDEGKKIELKKMLPRKKGDILPDDI